MPIHEGVHVEITHVHDDWYRLDVGEYPDRITFFGHSELDVLAKHKAYVRRLNHEFIERPDRSSYKLHGGFYG